MAENLREYGDQVEAALERFNSRLSQMTRRAAKGRVAVTSPSGSVRVEIGGDLCVRGVAIRPGTLSRTDEEALATVITETYNQALATMLRAQSALRTRALTLDGGEGSHEGRS